MATIININLNTNNTMNNTMNNNTNNMNSPNTMNTMNNNTPTPINRATLEAELNGFPKGRLGLVLITITKEHRLQKRAFEAAFGRKVKEVTKVSEVRNVTVGTSFDTKVGNRIEAAGGDASNWHSAAPTGKRWVPGFEGYILESLDGTKRYIRTYRDKPASFRVQYLIDGVLATPAEEALIRAHLREHTESVKQAAAGVAEENEVRPLDYGLDGIYGLFINARGIALGLDFATLLASL